MSPRSRSPFASIIVLGILAFTTGCDKDKAAREAVTIVRPVGTPAIDIARHPTLLFEVFGDRTDPRLLPVAAIIDSTVVAIGLNESGWHALDSIYFAPGAALPLYHDGLPVGRATVRRGMWTKDGALQRLPGCTAMRPLAAAQLSMTGADADSHVELLATSAPLVTRAAAHDAMSRTELHTIALAIGKDVATRHGLDASELDALDFSARAITTGATGGSTVVASFIDPGAGDLGPGAGHTTSVFALGDRIDGSWQATYRHAASGDARTVEFQRFLDHVDLDGDGVDEVLLESWRYGGGNALVVLRFKAGQWHEALRVPLGWCLDTHTTSGRARP
jgi:hypothetical protein